MEKSHSDSLQCGLCSWTTFYTKLFRQAHKSIRKRPNEENIYFFFRMFPVSDNHTEKSLGILEIENKWNQINNIVHVDKPKNPNPFSFLYQDLESKIRILTWNLPVGEVK